MKKTIVLLFLIAAIFFIAGYIFCFISGLIAEGDHGDEYHHIEELKKEASSFFYKTMRELYEGTYNPEDGYVSQSAYESFKEYKSKLEPKCHLAQINEAYGTFYGYAFFPSEDVFIIEMKRFEEKWRLITLDRVNTQSFWIDLQPNKDNEQEIKDN